MHAVTGATKTCDVRRGGFKFCGCGQKTFNPPGILTQKSVVEHHCGYSNCSLCEPCQTWRDFATGTSLWHL